MADKNLSVGIDVVLDINTKKLDALGERIGMTGKQLEEALNLKVDWTSLTFLKNEIVKLESRATSLGTTLSSALSANPAGQQEVINILKEQLSYVNKIKEANAQISSSKKNGKQVDIKQAIAQELFGDKAVDFNVGAFKSEIESRGKGWIEDFGDDAIELVDVLEDSSKTLLQDINGLAKEAAAEVGVKFKSSTEMLTGFNANTLEDGAETLAAGLKAVSENISLSGDLIINGQKFAEKDLVQSIRDFEVDSKGVFTISPAMFLDAYRKVIAKLGENLVTVNSTDYKDLSFKPLEGKAPAQAGQNVVDYMQKTLDEIAAKPGGSAKIDQKLGDLEEKIILEILEKARRAGERALKDPNEFNSRMLDTYAPSADTAAIAGSADTTNLERYADQEAAKVAHQLEQLYGLAEGTIAAYVKVFSQDSSDPNKLFDIVRAARAIVGSSFTDSSGTNVPSATSRGLVSGEGKTIGQQIIDNPAILQNVLGVQQEAFDKKVEALLAARIKDQGGLAPGDLEQAVQLALVQSLAGQIARIKISPTEVAKAAAEQALTTTTSAAEPFTLKDNKPRFREIIGREKLLQGEALAVGVDTEFNPKLNQNITEFSAIIKTATGEFVKLVDFIHMPLDRANLALDPSPAHVQAANSPEKLIERAKTLGYNAQDIGDTTDVEVNRRLMAQRAKEISDMFEVLAEYDVAITGSKLANAEGASIRKFINYVNTFVEGIAGTTIPQPDVLRKAFDSSKEFGLLDRNSDLASRLPSTPTGKSETKLQTIFAMMAKDFEEFFSNFSSVMRMTDSGPRFTSAAGREMTPHFAQADAMASIVVRELFRKFAPAAESTKATPATKSSAGSGGGGKIPPEPPTASAADDPMGERKANALAKAFYSQNEYTKMLSKLTSEEKDLIARRLQDLKANGEQIAISAAILEKETKLAQLRANMKGLRGADYSAAREEIRKLDAEVIKLTRSGQRNEEAVIAQVLAEGRHKKVTEQLTENARKQFDLAMQRDQAGKNFSVQIQAQLKAELEAQKAVQKANREQINQWVTGRYALYDVGNFYQNLSQQMFRLSRQIFNTTQVYRSFETAFTSVERAMQISGSAAVGMREQFVKLSETLPVTFEDLSKIATLGAQMGIGAGGIEDFTSTVAKFSAITTISADTVAQKFGRIAELAKIDSSEFQNLGSAVAFAGVNAVATESEILTLSESIAAVSTQAGLAPAEIIGMSTALASVGIQAEQARGVFTRVFADINRAVSRGGSELDAFAKVSGMSSEDFAKQWGTEGQSYNVFRKLLGGLGSSSDATKAFDALNIVETREVNTLTRLAESLGVVDQAVSDSNQSFADGTFLAASFEKTADNLDAQLIIFKNNVDSLVVSITQSLAPGLKEVLKFASGFIEVLKLGSKSSVVQWALPLGLGITAVGAAATAAVAGVSKLIAQIYAFRVANINAMNSSATDMGGSINKIKQLTGAYSGLIEVRSGLKGVAGPDTKGLITPVTFKARDIVSGQREAFAEFAKTRSLASATNIMNSTRENALMQSANILMVSANKNEAGSIALARQQADAVQRIVDARRQEIAALAEKGALEGISESEMLAQKFYVEITKNGAVAISQSEIAKLKEIAANRSLSASERELAASRLASIKAVNAETQTATKAVGLGFTGWLNKLTGVLGVVGILGTVISMVDMLRVSIEEANKVDLLGSGGGVQSLRDAMAEDTKVWRETGEAISTVESKYESYEPAVYEAYDAVVSVTGANKNLKTTTGEVTDKLEAQTVAIGQNTKEWIYNSIIGNEKVNAWIKDNPGLFSEAEDALGSYGTSFANLMNGVLKNPEAGGISAINKIDAALQQVSDKSRARLEQWNRENPEQSDPSLPTSMVKSPDEDAILARLVRQRAALQKLKAIFADVKAGLIEASDLTAFQASLKKAWDMAFDEDPNAAIERGTQKAAKTLTQWSGEVAQIISSALEIRAQKTTALDGITKAWSDLRKKADDAKKAVKKAQDQINSLKANRSTLEYQLNIAIKYGDSKRATEIQAKLDENTTSLSDASEQLAEAQKNASTELKGNSDAAIDNRATLRSLVNTYVPYIQALENSTVKGETFAQKQERIAAKVGVLKKEFESQALALGFAQKDLAAYLGDFDAMATIVKKVPNTVTVKIDGLPAALRALREFASSANTELGKIKLDDKAKDAALIKGYDDQISVLKFQAQAVNENKALSAAGRASSLSIIGNTIRDLVSKMAALKAKTYATGGYVSGAGTGTSDSIPARLSNGEFVMSAKSVGTYGVDFMNALNQSRVMYAPATPQASQASGGSSVVYLSPDDRALLRAAIDRPVNLYADSTRLAQSVNNGNKVLAQRGSI